MDKIHLIISSVKFFSKGKKSLITGYLGMIDLISLFFLKQSVLNGSGACLKKNEPVTCLYGLLFHKSFAQIKSLLHHLFISPDPAGIHGAPVNHTYDIGPGVSIGVLKSS